MSKDTKRQDPETGSLTMPKQLTEETMNVPKILTGDCREQMAKNVPNCSVYTAVTSPPYWGLRDYGCEGQLGLEETPAEYIANMVEVFGEVHRCLRDDGTLWVNIGDSYARNGGNGECGPNANVGNTTKGIQQRNCIAPKGLKPKDLAGIPWMLAFALREAGWYLRQDIIWHKPAPMPSSVKDRCTTAHEYMFLFSKSPRYHYDAFAISEPSVSGHGSGNGFKRPERLSFQNADGSPRGSDENWNASRRNKRSVWTVNTKGFKGAHFACYPPKLIEPCILAGSPERCCAECGKGYERVIETNRVATRPGNESKVGRVSDDDSSPYEGHSGSVVGNRDPKRHVTEYVDKGFAKSCECETNETRPAIVLDPFGGSGTTAQVAQDNGRDWIMCELNPEYVEMIKGRTEQGVLF